MIYLTNDVLNYLQGMDGNNKIFEVKSVHGISFPFKDEVILTKNIEQVVSIELPKQLAFQIGFINYVETFGDSFLCKIIIKNKQLNLKVNMLRHMTQLKLVSEFFNISNFELLTLTFDENEITNILLDKKPFIFRKLTKKLKLNNCNPKTVSFRMLNVIQQNFDCNYCKLTIDFRKNGK